MIHCLYKSTNTINGRFYIGVHSTDDVGFGTDMWVDPYVGSGKLVSQALKKYGRDAFIVEVVTYHDNEDDAYRAEADVVTEEWLAEHKGMVYNVVTGGGKPPNHTGVKRCPFTIRHKKRLSENHWDCAGDRNPMYGVSQIVSEATRHKLRQRALGDRNPFYGKRHTKKIRALMSSKAKERAALLRGKNVRQVECPHCHKVGGIGAMYRWHFTHCRSRA